jgi:hypothetical protein
LESSQNLWLNMKLLALSSLLMAALLLSAFFATVAKALGQQDQKNDGRGSIGIKDLVRREEAIPGMHVVQNGCAEMQASGTAVTGWRSDLPEGALRDIEHTEAKSPFVETLSGMHLSRH